MPGEWGGRGGGREQGQAAEERRAEERRHRGRGRRCLNHRGAEKGEQGDKGGGRGDICDPPRRHPPPSVGWFEGGEGLFPPSPLSVSPSRPNSASDALDGSRHGQGGAPPPLGRPCRASLNVGGGGGGVASTAIYRPPPHRRYFLGRLLAGGLRRRPAPHGAGGVERRRGRRLSTLGVQAKGVGPRPARPAPGAPLGVCGSEKAEAEGHSEFAYCSQGMGPE